MSDRIVVVCGGALGGYVAGHLARDGQDLTLVDMWPEHVDCMRRHGLQLGGLTRPENFNTEINALHLSDLHDMARGVGNYDIAFIATKSYDTVWATELIAPYLSPGGVVISLQNGINEERIAGVVGWGRTVGCIASKISVEVTHPGIIQRNIALGGNYHTVFRVGEVHGRITPRAEKIAALFAKIDSAVVTDNLWGERWSKLVVNCMRNPLSAATGRGGNDNDRDPRTRNLALRIAAEAIRIGIAHGYQIGNIYGMSVDDIMRAVNNDSAARQRCVEVLMASVAKRSDEQRPSMGQDMAKGRRTEIAYLNGLVVAKAKELGLCAPINAAMVEIVQRIERGELTASPEAVAAI
ncbi:MAG: ketopantoate reductase family protein [Hyphomicrobiaceae bacterium]